MSSIEVPAAIAPVEVPETLQGMLVQVQKETVDLAESKKMQSRLEYGRAAVWVTLVIWLVGAMMITQSVSSYQLLSLLLAVFGKTLIFLLLDAAVVAAGLSLGVVVTKNVKLPHGDQNRVDDDMAKWLTYGSFLLMGVGALGAVVAVLPFFPLVLALAAWFYWKEDGEFPLWHNVWAPAKITDSRLTDLKGLQEHLDAWKQISQWANQLQLRVTHNLLKGNDRARALVLLNGLIADEEFVHNRVAYCEALAQQGALGTLTVRDDMGALLIGDLSNQLDGFRQRMEELREFDRQAFAAHEVNALKT